MDTDGGAATERVWNAIPSPLVPCFRACPHRFCPGGTPEEISRGQVRASGRRPRKLCGMAPCPSGASKKWRGTLGNRGGADRPEATSDGGDAAGRPTPKTSPLPRWGMARSAWPPGAAPAGAGLPPANFLRRPSGTKSRALATILCSSSGGESRGKTLAARANFVASQNGENPKLTARFPITEGRRTGDAADRCLPLYSSWLGGLIRVFNSTVAVHTNPRGSSSGMPTRR